MGREDKPLSLHTMLTVEMGLKVSHCDENGERTPCHHDVIFKFGKIEIPASLLLPYGRLVAWYELELGLGRLFRCLLLNMDNCDKDNDTSNNSSNNENGENAMAAQIQIHIMT